MMGKVVDHIVSELKEDLDKANKDRKHVREKRKSNQMKVDKLLAEILETERIYVQDLEQVCGDYAQLAGVSGKHNCLSLDRKKEDKKLSRQFSIRNSKSSQDYFMKSTGPVSNKE